MDSYRPRSARGFSLVEMTMVLLIIGISLGGGLAAFTKQQQDTAVRNTRERQKIIAAALNQFASEYHRLPCPSDAGVGLDSTSSGLEVRDPDNADTCFRDDRVRGVPWRTLDIPMSVTLDGWNNQFTYRVFSDRGTGNSTDANVGDRSLTRDDGLDMRDCRASTASTGSGGERCADPMTGITTSVLDFLSGRGLTVMDRNGTTLLSSSTAAAGGGAAWILISHGENGWGAYRQTGTRNSMPGSGFTRELANATSDPAAVYSGTPLSISTAVPASFSDDIVIFANTHAVINAAGLGVE